MAASPVRRSRRIGSRRKVVCSQTPVRTRGSASSMITAVTPPMKSESGFLNTRHDTESGDTSAGSPAGRKKSMENRVAGIKQRPSRERSVDVDASLGKPNYPAVQGFRRHREGHCIDHAASAAAAASRHERKERENRARLSRLVSVIEMIGAGIVEVDRALDQPKADNLRV